MPIRSEFADPGVSPYRALKNKQLGSAIETAVENLPPDYREREQRYFQKLSEQK